MQQLHAECAEHALGVIARERRLRHVRAAARGETRQQDRGFHLRARHRQTVVNAPQMRRTTNQDRWPPLLRLDSRSHHLQRHGDSLHRPAHEGLVADERRVEILRREQPHHQAHGGTGIAHVEGRARRREAVRAHPAHQHLRVERPLDAHPELLQRPRGGEAVLAGQKATDVRVAFGKRAEHERAVRDRLVPRHREGALDAAAGADAITGGAGPAHSTARG